MCGIAGIFAPRKLTADRLRDSLHIMSEAILHRGPDSHDTWIDETISSGFAHRRLSIVDLSEAGAQPMHSHCGRYIICYNGEMYATSEIRQELEKKKHRFNGHSDTEVIIQACAQWGVEKAVAKMVGEFAFALWDTKEHTLTLVRDRLGVKPLYWSFQNQIFGFSSELHSLMRSGFYEAYVSPEAMNAYLKLGYIPEPLTIYQKIHKLSPGQILTYKLGETPRLHTYWNFHQVAGAIPDPSITYNRAKSHVHKLIRQSVKGQMMSDVPLGSLLSGGIDSSLVTAVLQEQASSPIKTFTIGFEEQNFNEAAFAKEVAKHLGTDHHEQYVTAQDARDVIPLLPKMYSEPFADVSAIPTHLVAKLARSKVTVTLSGDGGDEVFGGYSRYDFAQKIAHYKQLAMFPSLIGYLLEMIPTSLIPEFLGKKHAARLNRLGTIFRSSDAYLTYRLVQQWDPEQIINPDLQHEFTTAYEQSFHPDLIENFMIADTLQYLPGDILAKVDRASMAVSLESRIPLLDHRLVEYAWHLPMEYKRNESGGKRILKDILYEYVPRNLVDRPKMGFGVPIGEWIRGPLHDWAETLVASDTAKQYFDRKNLRKLMDQHVSGAVDNPYRLWGVLSFLAWHEGVSHG